MGVGSRTHGARSQMHPSTRQWLHVSTDIAHDLSAGLWPGAALAVWFVSRRASVGLSAPDPVALRPLWAAFSVMLIALVLTVVTGIARVNFTGILSGSPATRGRLRVALVKHAVFVAVLVAATLLAFSALRG